MFYGVAPCRGNLICGGLRPSRTSNFRGPTIRIGRPYIREGKELPGCAGCSRAWAPAGICGRLGRWSPKIAPVFFAIDIPATLR